MLESDTNFVYGIQTLKYYIKSIILKVPSLYNMLESYMKFDSMIQTFVSRFEVSDSSFVVTCKRLNGTSWQLINIESQNFRICDIVMTKNELHWAPFEIITSVKEITPLEYTLVKLNCSGLFLIFIALDQLFVCKGGIL